MAATIRPVPDPSLGQPIRCPHCGETCLPPAPQPETLPLPPDTPADHAAPRSADVPPPSLGIPLADQPPPPAAVAPAELPAHVGRFEIRQRLGEGAFGVVYRAYDPQLEREVALKVAKPEHLGSAPRVQRFLREAKAAANLRHPHIVPVFDSGCDGGHYYIASAFIPGRSLADTLSELPDGQTFPLRQAAEVVRRLAEALAYAHGRNVVHRDVKPSNVMVAEQGEPLLVDFGLAARDEDAAKLSQEGAKGLGTPAYMAPEQAAGKGQPASDQYSLGCTLYELLTGQTPFAGPPEIQLVLHQSEEPTSPRQVNRQVPRDLETVCLKCLAKEPARRYADCQALADDLRRWLEGEPVMARRLGPLERLGKWARRRPAVAALTAAVAAALLLGAGVASYFAADAYRQAGLATDRENTANTERAKAVAAQKDLERSTDDLVTSVADGILGSLAWEAMPNAPPLSAPEVKALWELAASKEERVRIRFVQEALRGPLQTRQMKNRAAYALQATVVLDDARRTQVEQILGQGLQTPGSTPEQQRDVALTLAQFGIQDASLAGKVVATLSQAMKRTKDPAALLQLAQGLGAVAARMEPKEAAAVCGQAAANLTQTMAQTTDGQALAALAQGLAAVAARMGPKEAGEAAATLTQAMAKTMNGSALQYLAQGLAAVAARMEPKDAAVVCGQAVASLTRAMVKTTDGLTVAALAWGLPAVAAPLGPKEAGETAATLSQAMGKTTDSGALPILANALSVVATRMEPKEAAATLIQAMAKTPSGYALAALAQGLGAVAARMEPKEAAVVCGQAAASLTQAMAKTPSGYPLAALAWGLPAVAAPMGPKEAGEAAATLTQAMTRTTDPNALLYLAQGLAAVAARMEPKDAAVVCGQAVASLSQAMTKTTDGLAVAALAWGLSAVAAPMGPKEAAATLSQAMTKTTSGYALGVLAQGLSAAAARMEPKEAAVLCGQAAATLSQAISKTTDGQALAALAQGLGAVAARMEPKEAAAVCGQAAATLTQAMAQTTDLLAEGLSAVLHREDTSRSAQRRNSVAGAVGVLSGPGSGLVVPGLLQPALEPPPPPLPAQTLVDLLKQPLCVGEARRLVLEQLQRHYQRPFADQWDFVRFAQEQHLSLDLKTPLQRPAIANMGGMMGGLGGMMGGVGGFGMPGMGFGGLGGGLGGVPGFGGLGGMPSGGFGKGFGQ
jgi:hypothetical protein